MRIAICDDETFENENLEKLIKEYAAKRDFEVRVDAFTKGRLLLQQPRYDLYFLDYKMDEMDGIAVAKGLKQKFNHAVTICYLTNFDGAAEEIINNRIHADGFLKKPVDRDLLFDKLDLFYRMSFFTRFELRKSGVFETIYAQDILYVSADNKRVQLHMADRTEAYNYLLRELEPMLADCGLFCRIHRSFIVNMMYVRRYDSTSVEMENGEILPLKVREFKDRYQDYIFSQHH